MRRNVLQEARTMTLKYEFITWIPLLKGVLNFRSVPQLVQASFYCDIEPEELSNTGQYNTAHDSTGHCQTVWTKTGSLRTNA